MNVINAVKAAINKIEPRNEVILFGSRARGDFKKDSDWDFLILLDIAELEKQKKETILAALYQLELATNQVISSIIHTKKDWQARAITPIHKIIEQEGIAA